MITNLNRIKNNNIIFINQRLHLFDNISNDFKNFLCVRDMVPGVHDIRARIGTFNNPWGATVKPWYAPPPFEFINDTLSDLFDARAIELINVAKQKNKQLVINWSGGIDSTSVLISFLKNTTPADQKLITVCCNTTSIKEYLNFYLKFISPNNNIQIKTSNTLVVSKEYLDKNIIIHGDPGDCIFGPSQFAYRYFSDNKQHLESWKKHSKKIIELLENSLKIKGHKNIDAGKWWFNIVTRTLEESGQSDYISSVSDLWWWTYYNFKWSFSCQRLLFFGLSNTDNIGLPIEYQQESADYTYFNTKKFQQWSYSNLKKLIGITVSKSIKAEAKKYIYEFTKDYEYVQTKVKTASAFPTILKKMRTSIYGYDENYLPIYHDWRATAILQSIVKKWREKR